MRRWRTEAVHTHVSKKRQFYLKIIEKIETSKVHTYMRMRLT